MPSSPHFMDNGVMRLFWLASLSQHLTHSKGLAFVRHVGAHRCVGRCSGRAPVSALISLLLSFALTQLCKAFLYLPCFLSWPSEIQEMIHSRQAASLRVPGTVSLTPFPFGHSNPGTFPQCLSQGSPLCFCPGLVTCSP